MIKPTAVIAFLFFALAAGAETLPAPVAEDVSQTLALCEPAATIRPEALLSADINADGKPDFLLDQGGLDCSTMATMYCGSGGCGYSVYLSQPQGYHIYSGLGMQPTFTPTGIKVMGRSGEWHEISVATMMASKN